MGVFLYHIVPDSCVCDIGWWKYSNNIVTNWRNFWRKIWRKVGVK